MVKIIHKIQSLIVIVLCLVQLSCNAEKKEQPNVLFIAIDDLNDWTGSMGGNNQAITPNLDKLATEGVLFTNAHSSMAVCVASRNSLLSGMHPITTGWYPIVEDHDKMVESYDQVMNGKKMLPQLFKESGYKTFCAGKIFHAGATDFPFLLDSLWSDVLPDYKSQLRPIDYERGAGYGGYIFYPFPKEPSRLIEHYGTVKGAGHSLCGGPLEPEDIPGGKMYDEMIADYAVDKLQQDHNEPFFLSVGFVRPHVPYTAPKKYFELYDFDKIEIPDVPENEMEDIPLMGKSIVYNYANSIEGDYKAVTALGEEYWRHLIYSYLACVSFVDDQLGRVLQALENSQYADNTIIVLWSDHGQSMGEKRDFRKMSLWEESTRVPLCIVAPEFKSNGERCLKPVSLLDIYPTLADLCDLPKQDYLDGNSLKPLLRNVESDWSYPVLTSWRYKNFSVRTQDYRYIQYRDGTTEFYDHRTDQGEHHNLAQNEKYKSLIDEHRKFVPEKVALPAGISTWQGDELDRKIKEWEKSGEIPAWLK